MDLISRQAAFDAFGLSEQTRKYGGDHSGYDTRMLYEIQETLENLPFAQPDGEYISQQAVTESDLIDWYINSVDESEPVWTEEHIYELFNDFYLIPKED